MRGGWVPLPRACLCIGGFGGVTCGAWHLEMQFLHDNGPHLSLGVGEGSLKQSCVCPTKDDNLHLQVKQLKKLGSRNTLIVDLKLATNTEAIIWCTNLEIKHLCRLYPVEIVCVDIKWKVVEFHFYAENNI